MKLLPSSARPGRLRALSVRAERSDHDEFGDWQLARRDPLTKFYPEEETVALGMPREALDARWGKPKIPAWARKADRVTAIYPRAPFTVDLDRDERRVTGVTLYAGRHCAVTSDGEHPCSCARPRPWSG
jgi:hypothetical protein